jgi:hypothetical protein
MSASVAQLCYTQVPRLHFLLHPGFVEVSSRVETPSRPGDQAPSRALGTLGLPLAVLVLALFIASGVYKVTVKREHEFLAGRDGARGGAGCDYFRGAGLVGIARRTSGIARRPGGRGGSVGGFVTFYMLLMTWRGRWLLRVVLSTGGCGLRLRRWRGSGGAGAGVVRGQTTGHCGCVTSVTSVTAGDRLCEMLGLQRLSATSRRTAARAVENRA